MNQYQKTPFAPEWILDLRQIANTLFEPQAGEFWSSGLITGSSSVTLSSTVGIAANRQRASVVSQKFVVEFAKATTGPSTPQAAKYAVCFAQDDNSLLRELLGQDTREALIKSDATLSIPSGAKQAAFWAISTEKFFRG